MVALDNLVVSTALHVHPVDLGANIQPLQWLVNAYMLSFAVLLMTGAALGDRFGRRRIFVLGLTLLHPRLGGRRLAPTTERADRGAYRAGLRRRRSSCRCR